MNLRNTIHEGKDQDQEPSAGTSQKRAVRKAEDLLIDKLRRLLMPFGTNQLPDARRHAGSGVGGPAQARVMT